MRRVDELHLEMPYAGARMLSRLLKREGNVFLERLWRSVKYEEVYLHAYNTVSDAKTGLQRYFARYNQIRPHSSLDDKTQDEFYSDNLPALCPK